MRNGTTAKGKGCARIPVRDYDPGEQTYESPVMKGGFENSKQILPSGEAHFVFQTFDPGRIDSFETFSAEKLLRRLAEALGNVRVIRTYGYTWTVEDSEDIIGTISADNEKKPGFLRPLASGSDCEAGNECSLTVTMSIVTYGVGGPGQ